MYNKLFPLQFHIQKVLPFVYDDSMSLYELVAKLQNGLNAVIENQNNVVDETQRIATGFMEEMQTLYCWIKSQAIADQVDNILNTWLEDGTLARIVSDYKNGCAVSLGSFTTPYREAREEDLQRDITNMTAMQFYSLFDSLVEGNRYAIRNFWGNDGAGNPLYYYTFRARKYDDIGENYNDQNIIDNLEDRLQTNPTLIITSGVHGNEKTAIYSLYLAMKYYMEGTPEGDYLLNNYNIVLLPCVNPSGINSNGKLNYNNVNLNRNFYRGWDKYIGKEGTDNYKGASALSEAESKFVDEVMQIYSDMSGKCGTTVIDFHTSHYPLHDDKRVLWFTANFYDMRPRIIKFAEWCKNRILEWYPSLKPNYDKGEIFSRFVYVTDPTLANHAKKYGFWGTVCDIPDTIEMLDSMQYGYVSKRLGFLIAYNYIFQMAEFSDRGTKQVYNSLLDIGANNSMHLSEVVEAVPNGSTLNVRISSDTALLEDMPRFLSGGILTITKSPTPSSVKATCMYQTVCNNTTKLWVNSFDNSAENGWVQLQPAFMDNTMITEGTNLATLIDKMPVSTEALFRITSSSPLWSEMPAQENGILRITKVYNSTSEDYISIAVFFTTATTVKKYETIIYNGTPRTWKQVY